MSKPKKSKKPTKRQEDLADRFRSGESVGDLAWAEYARSDDRVGVVEEAVRVTMNWRDAHTPAAGILDGEVFRRMLDCSALASGNFAHPENVCISSDDIAEERERRGEK